MSYFTSGEEWQRQSALLLQARPTTTRITTKYHIPNPSSTLSPSAAARNAKKLAKRTAALQQKAAAANSDQQSTSADTPATKTPSSRKTHAYLELKTYDPNSGVCLKYKTDKAAEVGRLTGALGRLGREMAALPPLKAEEQTVVEEVKHVTQAAAGAVAAAVAPLVGDAATAKPQTGGNAGGKKKKKGKR